MYIKDEWPSTIDGNKYNGKDLLKLVKECKSPFQDSWDVELLIREVESTLDAKVRDIISVSKGSNNYGFHMDLDDDRQVVARLSQGDVNMPNYDGWPFEGLVEEVEFEAAIYAYLCHYPIIKASVLLHHRAPVRLPNAGMSKPVNILGRKLLLYLRAEGENNIWRQLDHNNKMVLLSEAAHIRAALFHFPVPAAIAQTWLATRMFSPKPKVSASTVRPTRQFCLDLLTSKVEATIGELGTMIGWEDDHEVVGLRALAAKSALLRLIPLILPDEQQDANIYRLVIEHGDFGIHNMSIGMKGGVPHITSLYDWEEAKIVPAILSDPQMAVTVDLDVNADADPIITRVAKNKTREDLEEFQSWSDHHYRTLFDQAPDYKQAIKSGSAPRHIWFSLRAWRGGRSEEYFGALGTWAEKRLEELGTQASS